MNLKNSPKLIPKKSSKREKKTQKTPKKHELGLSQTKNMGSGK